MGGWRAVGGAFGGRFCDKEQEKKRADKVMNGKPPARGPRDPPGQSAAVCDFEAARGHRPEQKRLSSTHQGASEVQMRAHCNTCVSPFLFLMIGPIFHTGV